MHRILSPTRLRPVASRYEPDRVVCIMIHVRLWEEHRTTSLRPEHENHSIPLHAHRDPAPTVYRAYLPHIVKVPVRTVPPLGSTIVGKIQNYLLSHLGSTRAIRAIIHE